MGRGERGLHTNHSQINSLLPQSTILPPFSLPHLSLLPSFGPLLLLLHSSYSSSVQFLVFSTPLSVHPFHISSSSLPLHPLYGVPRFIPVLPAQRPSERKKNITPASARGVDGGLCPWSRCLTWTKPAKKPHCQGSGPGCKPGRKGQTEGGQEIQGRGGPQGQHAL